MSEDADEGRCRFNCRTAKENFVAGMRAGNGYRPDTLTAEDIEYEWKRQQAKADE